MRSNARVLNILMIGLTGVVFCGAVGCANSSVIAHGTNRSGRVFGEAGITGNNNTFTVERGSRIHHFSIIGDNNSVMIEDGVWLQKVEVWGSNNTLSVPDYLPIRYTEVGKGNRIERRQTNWNLPAMEADYPGSNGMSIRDVSAPPASGSQPPASGNQPPANPYITPAPQPAATPAAPDAGGNYTAPPSTP